MQKIQRNYQYHTDGVEHWYLDWYTTRKITSQTTHKLQLLVCNFLQIS